MEQESPGKELPKTNAALLDFHASENLVKHNKTYGTAASFLVVLTLLIGLGRLRCRRPRRELPEKKLARTLLLC